MDRLMTRRLSSSRKYPAGNRPGWEKKEKIGYGYKLGLAFFWEFLFTAHVYSRAIKEEEGMTRRETVTADIWNFNVREIIRSNVCLPSLRNFSLQRDEQFKRNRNYR